MGRKWSVDIEGTKYVVEARYGTIVTSGSGEVLVDGKVADAWGSSFWGLPQERSFEIAGRRAVLRRRGVVSQNFELFVVGGTVTRL
ncbi:MAG: hypothetical protein HWN68_15305 [Desulfobacterales bacterium]|nr:hypothetical protein [Desulfobacterales bacterium]